MSMLICSGAAVKHRAPEARPAGALAMARRARPAGHDDVLRAQNALGSTLGLAGE